MLRPGDTVRLVSPASPSDEGSVARITGLLEGFGLRVQRGEHILDRHGYLAAQPIKIVRP